MSSAASSRASSLSRGPREADLLCPGGCGTCGAPCSLIAGHAGSHQCDDHRQWSAAGVAPLRGDVDLTDLTVQPATVRRYATAIARFQDFLSTRQLESLETLVADPPSLDDALVLWLETIFRRATGIISLTPRPIWGSFSRFSQLFLTTCFSLIIFFRFARSIHFENGRGRWTRPRGRGHTVRWYIHKLRPSGFCRLSKRALPQALAILFHQPNSSGSGI